MQTEQEAKNVKLYTFEFLIQKRHTYYEQILEYHIKVFTLKNLLPKEKNCVKGFIASKDSIDRIDRRVKYRFITVLLEFAANLIKVNQ